MQLRELRKMHNMTQAECAKYLGIPLRTYQNYERDDINKNNMKYQFMMSKLEQYGYVDETHGILDIDQIKLICEPILKKYKARYCYLFGSYAKGNPKETSDVDLLIYTEVTGIRFYELVEELRVNLKKKVDLLNQNQIKNNFDLVNEILLYGIKIYG